MFGNAPTPPVPQLPPEPANAPTFASASSMKSSANPSSRPLGGMASTILTSNQSFSPSATTKKSLLGQ